MGLLSLFRRENSRAAVRERQDAAERALAKSLQALGTLFTRLAERVEKQRLERNGYEQQEKFLERLEDKPHAK